MKHIYFLLLFLTSFYGFAQIPAGYYDTATGTEYALKTQLHNIINGHTDNGYGGLYTTYSTSDRDNYYENNGTVLDMYSENPSGIDSYEFTYEIEIPDDRDSGSGGTSEGEYYNREHIIPQSVFNSNYPMRSDAHFVVPSDKYVNGQRGSFPFGVVQTPNYTSTNGSKRGNNLNSGYSAGYSGTVFEPIDEFKGDIARMFFYFATRYENNIASFNSYTMLDGSSDHSFDDTFLNILLQWHSQDPVSQREIDRNNAIYNRQSNRNPFIDHPEYVGQIWNPVVDTEDPTDPTNLVASNPTDNSIDLNWTASTDNIAVVSYDVYIGGIFNFNTTNTTSVTANGLTANTNYCFTIIAKDSAGNESGFSNQDCEMTTNIGSGSNCTEETFESIPANSSSYSDRTWTGDNGLTWNATAARTDQTLNSRAITIRDGSLTAPTTTGGIGNLTVTTQLVFSGSAGTFDLKVNGVSVGTIPYDATSQTTTINNINIENNVTIVFDSNSSGSNRVRFDDLSWTCYSVLGTDDNTLSNLVMYPNPAKNNTVRFSTTQDLNVIIYDVLGKQVLTKKVTSNKNYINIESLRKGIYIVKLTSEHGEVTKKLIKQ